MEEHPDSALILLERLNSINKLSGYNRALFNMLITHARYKNFIDDGNDSIISNAVDFFMKNNNKEEASRSLFLKGMIQLNDGKLGEAAVSFSKGAEIAHYNGFYLWEGQCNRGLFLLYKQLMDGSSQLKYAKESYKAFSKTGHTDWINYSKYDIACAYHNNGQYNKSVSIANKLRRLASQIKDSLLIEESTYLIALSSYCQRNFSESIHYYTLTYNLNKDLINDSDIDNIVTALSLLNEEKITKQDKKLISDLENANKIKPNFYTFAKEGKYEDAYRLLNLYKNEQDSVLAVILHNNVSESIKHYQESKKELDSLRNKNKLLIYVFLSFVILTLAILIIIKLKIRIRSIEIENERLIENISCIKNDIKLQIEKTSKSSDTNDAKDDPFEIILTEKYSEINALCDDYYQDSGSSKLANKDKYKKVKQLIQFFTDRECICKLEEHVDRKSNNLYSSFKREVHNLSEDDKSLFLYLYLEFSTRTIAVFYGIQTSAVYNRKSRLKARIKESDSIRLNDYLRIFG
ncbi:MAG: hypothetical protein NC095_01000 [Muribaculum sp.]|nr:hypothetical protein [Muribaculum sp.]